MPMRSLLVALAVAFATGPLGATVAAAQQEPPRRLEFDTAAPAPRRITDRATANGFVRDQTILGLFVYAPAFATAVGRDGLTSTAAYLVVAGGSFFMATELARRLEITEARRDLAFGLPLRGAGEVLILGYAADIDAAPRGALVFLGSIGGLAGGLAMGRGLTAGEGAGTLLGHDLAYLSAMAVTAIVSRDPRPLDVREQPMKAAAWTAAGVAGLLLGRRYVAGAAHNVTAGDVQVMWLGTSIGALGGLAVVDGPEGDERSAAAAALVGGLTGTWLADRYLARRLDHTRSEGNVLSFGALAGGLMGVGIGVLAGAEMERSSTLTLGLATAGAVGGLALTERYLQPAADGGRLTGEIGRVRLDPLAGVAAAVGAPGRHTLLSITF